MTNRMLLLAATLVAAAPLGLRGQQFTHLYDHVLNDQGTARFTLATGIPYLGIGEYAYGISSRVTVGVMAGVTSNVEAYGVRARAVLYQPDPGFRIYFCTPVYFYPKSHIVGGDPWWLTRPNINFEWMTKQGFRYKVGGSLIAAASHYTLFSTASNATLPPRVWDAVHGGISFPVAAALTFQLEASLVMKGLRVAGTDWVGGPPVVLVLGTSWTP